MVAIDSQSSLSRLLSTQSQLSRLDREIGTARAELASGRHADIGLELGARTANVIGLRVDIGQIAAMSGANELAATRLQSTQGALDSIRSAASGFLEALVAARGNVTTKGIVEDHAKGALERVIEALGTRMAGMNVFSGIAVDQTPLEQYFATPQPASRTAVAGAFATQFGVTQDDPAVSSIDASAMQAYATSVIDNLFTDASWASTWSAASDEPLVSRIDEDATMTSSVSANEPALRDLIKALVLVADSGAKNLNGNAFGVVIDRAIELTGQSMAGLAELQGRVGVMQNRIVETNDVLEARRFQFTQLIGDAEDVDVTELSTRLSALISQMEAAFTMTARLQRLSLLDVL